MNPCALCDKDVEAHQDALQCDMCKLWQHRECDTGLSREKYENICLNDVVFIFECCRCRNRENEDVELTPIKKESAMKKSADGAESSSSSAVSFIVETDVPIETRRTEDPSEDEEVDLDDLDDVNDDMLADVDDVDDINDKREYIIIGRGTTRGKPMLVCNDGHSYTIRDKAKDRTFWRCSQRGKAPLCPASVVQYGESFVLKTEHNHTPDKLTTDRAPRTVRERPQPRTSPRKRIASRQFVSPPKPVKLPRVKQEPVLCKQEIMDDEEWPENLGEYRVIQNGTKRGRPMLVHTEGFAYHVKCAKKKVTTWRCAVRSKYNVCTATVLQRSNAFKWISGHNHDAEPGLDKKMVVRAKVKEKALVLPFKSTASIISEVLYEEGDFSALPNSTPPGPLKRLVNRYKAAAIPKEMRTVRLKYERLNNSALDIDIERRIIRSELMDFKEEDFGKESIGTYIIIENGTKRNQPKLVNSEGYSYTGRAARKKGTLWRCAVRGKGGKCLATVIQRGEQYRLIGTHSHEAVPGVVEKISLSARAKEKARETPFKSAMTIIKEVLIETGGHLDIKSPQAATLKRVVNREKAHLLPKRPRKEGMPKKPGKKKAKKEPQHEYFDNNGYWEVKEIGDGQVIGEVEDHNDAMEEDEYISGEEEVAETEEYAEDYSSSGYHSQHYFTPASGSRSLYKNTSAHRGGAGGVEVRTTAAPPTKVQFSQQQPRPQYEPTNVVTNVQAYHEGMPMIETDYVQTQFGTSSGGMQFVEAPVDHSNVQTYMEAPNMHHMQPQQTMEVVGIQSALQYANNSASSNDPSRIRCVKKSIRRLDDGSKLVVEFPVNSNNEQNLESYSDSESLESDSFDEHGAKYVPPHQPQHPSQVRVQYPPSDEPQHHHPPPSDDHHHHPPSGGAGIQDFVMVPNRTAKSLNQRFRDNSSHQLV